MRIFEVVKMPRNHNGVHQSIYQSDGILKLVKELLKDGVPAKTILELVKEIEEQEPVRELVGVPYVGTMKTIPLELYDKMCDVIQDGTCSYEKRRDILRKISDYKTQAMK